MSKTPPGQLANTAQSVSKQDGVTPGERHLSLLCHRSFLSLWSYPCVFRSQGIKNGGDGREVCDLLVVFGNDILIFSDKDCAFPNSGDLDVDWSRWFRRAVKGSADQIWGAERWIRSYPRRLFLDRICSQSFPLLLPDMSQARFHRIVVAHGAAIRCRELLGGTGSLMLCPKLQGKAHYDSNAFAGSGFSGSQKSGILAGKVPYQGKLMPFMIGDLDETKGFVHVFDDSSLEVVMSALDTAADFVSYLIKKEAYLRSGHLLFAGGEDDLVAHYLQEVNAHREHDFAIPGEPDCSVIIPEGEWTALVASEEWLHRTRANQTSYFWDRVIENFNGHILGGTSVAYPTYSLEQQERAVRALARETRLSRRVLATALGEFLSRPTAHSIAARVVMPPRLGSPHYIFLTVTHDPDIDETEYRKRRRAVVNAYSLAMKIRFPEATDVVIIATEPRGSKDGSSEDLAYFDLTQFSAEQETQAREIQLKAGFLAKLGEAHHAKEYECPNTRKASFARQPLKPKPVSTKRPSSGRNSPCPCGSGKKFKKCCLRH